MAVMDKYPGIGVVVRNNGLLVQEYPVADTNETNVWSGGPWVPCAETYIQSSKTGAFSVDVYVDEKYNFSRDVYHQIRFILQVDKLGANQVCDITKEDVLAADGCVRATFDIALGFRKDISGFGSQYSIGSAAEKERLWNIEVRVFRDAVYGDGSKKCIHQDRGPIAIYRFLYRTKDALVEAGMIPPLSPPQRLPPQPRLPALTADRGAMAPRGRDKQQEPAEPRTRSQPGMLRYVPDLPAMPAIAKSRGPDKRQELIKLRDKYELLLSMVNRQLDELPDLADKSPERPAKRSRTQEKRFETIDLTED